MMFILILLPCMCQLVSQSGPISIFLPGVSGGQKRETLEERPPFFETYMVSGTGQLQHFKPARDLGAW